MRKVLCIITASIILVTMLSGCSVLKRFGFKDNDELQPVSSIVMDEEEAKALTDKMPIYLYFATEDNSKLKLEVRHIDISEGKKSANHLAGIIVKELIAGPKDSSLKATIPQGTQLIGSVNIDAKVATVNLSKDLLDKHPGGEAEARMTIYSIVNSLTELNEIEKVKFLVDGKQKADFKGAYKFDNSFPRTASLISNQTGNVAAVSKTNDSSVSQKTNTKNGATPSPTPKATVTPKASAAPKATITPSPKATTTPKATAAPKASSTPATKSSNETGSSNTALEDAEATYLEVLE